MACVGCELVVILPFGRTAGSPESSEGRLDLDGRDESSDVSPSSSYSLGSESSAEVHSDEVEEESVFVKFILVRLLNGRV